MSRKDLGLSEKIAVLDSIDAEPHCSSRRLAEIMGISKSSILRIRRDEKRLRALWASENRRDVKRYRESKCPEVDEALRRWYNDLGPRGQSLSGSVLMKKAEQLALELGKNDFRATDGWLSRWKQRHSIKFKRSPADVSTANQWRALRLPECLQSFSADDIYNAAELSLFHRLQPSSCQMFDTLSALEKYRDRLTVLCCTNMSGSDKRQLLIIGHSVEPICVDELKLENFQFLFYANNNARMTTPIFSSWLAAWDEELQRSGRRALLLVDDCVPRPPFDSLKNIIFEFMPTNIISKIQPLSMGVIDNLKALYNASMTEYLSQTVGAGSMASSPELNLMQAALIAADSWKNVSQTLIQECFAQAGFKRELALSGSTPETARDQTPTFISSGDSEDTVHRRSWIPEVEFLTEGEVTPGSASKDNDHGVVSGSVQMPSSISSDNSEESPQCESWIPKTSELKTEEAVPKEYSVHHEPSCELETDQKPSFIASGNSEEFAHCESWIPRAGPEKCTESREDAKSSPTRANSIIDHQSTRRNSNRVTISTSDAIRCLEKVRRYFSQESGHDCPTAELEKCMEYVLKRQADKN